LPWRHAGPNSRVDDVAKFVFSGSKS